VQFALTNVSLFCSTALFIIKITYSLTQRNENNLQTIINQS